mgnify:CR=1 FL=1
MNRPKALLSLNHNFYLSHVKPNKLTYNWVFKIRLFPLNSPSKKVNKKDSYSNGSEHIITRISPRETHVKPAPNNSNNELIRAGATVRNLF